MRSLTFYRSLPTFRGFHRHQTCIITKIQQFQVMRPSVSVKYLPTKYVSQYWFYQQPKRSFSRVLNLQAYNSETKCADEMDNAYTLIERLELHINRLERVKFADIELLLQYMKSGVVPHSHPGLLLLTCCSSYIPDMNPILRLALVRSIWDDLKAVGTDFDVNYYNALLKCYSKCQHAVESSKFLQEMGDTELNEKTYQLLLKCACESGDMEEATKVLQLMKEKEFPANEDVFSDLILGYTRAGDIEGAEMVLKTMLTANVEPRAATYTALLRGYAEVGNLESILKTIQKAKSENINLSERQIMEICKSLAKVPEKEFIMKFLASVDEAFVFTPVVNNTVLELVHLHQEKAAYFLLKSLVYDPETSNEENAFAIFVSEMCNANSNPETIIELCNLLSETGAFSRALYKATESCLRLSRTELALTLLREQKSKGVVLRPHYFWPIILQRRFHIGEKGVFDTLKDMVALGVNADFETLLHYVLPSMPLIDPEELVQKLQDAGLKLRLVATPVVIRLLQSNNIPAAVDLCKHYPTRIDFSLLERPLARAFCFSKDLKSCMGILEMMKVQKSDSPGRFLLELLCVNRSPLKLDDVVNILEHFQKRNMKISSYVSDELVKYLETRAGMTETYQRGLKIIKSIASFEADIVGTLNGFLTHPRNMTGEELEAHLVELKAKNMNTRGVLRHLFQHYNRTGNMERALEILEEFKENNFKLSPGMKSSLFHIYVRLKDIKSAEACLADLLNESPGFIIDDYKIVDYATVLVLENQYKAALTALERRAAAGKIKGGKEILSNCVHLVTAVASTMDPDHTKHMLQSLVTYGYCTVSTVLLGPLIKSYIMQKDWSKAVSEFQRCVREYKKTPLQQELLQSLVANGLQDELVEVVLSASATINGKTNSLVAYAGALAETNKEKQLNQFLSENPTILNSHDFVRLCQWLAGGEKLTALTLFMNVCRGSLFVEPAFFCNLILQIHSKNGNCDAALNLWTLMQERDILPSQEFMIKLASLLKSHKKPVPFVVSSDL